MTPHIGNSRKHPADDPLIRCQSLCRQTRPPLTELFVIWHEYLGDDSNSVYDEYKNVEIRVGSESASTQRWGISTDKQATFASGAIELLRKMAKEDRLVLQTIPYNEAPMMAVFDLTGAEAAIGEVAKTCGWEL